MQIVKLARESELELARVTELLEELKSEVSGAVTSFTQGGAAIEFQERMEKLGIKLDCNLEDLKQISQSEPARCVIFLTFRLHPPGCRNCSEMCLLSGSGRN